MANEVILELLSGPDKGKQHKVTHSPFVIGRDKAADVMIDDPRVQEWHCLIVTEGDKIAAKAVEGRIWVNRQRTFGIYLKDQDRLSFGSVEVQVRIREAKPVPAPVSLPLLGGGPAPAAPVAPAVEAPPPEPVIDPERIGKGEIELCRLGDSSLEPPPKGRPLFPEPDRSRCVRMRFAHNGTFTPAHAKGLLFAIIDGARDLDLAWKAKMAGFEPVSLFVGSSAPQLAEVAPYFFPLPVGAPFFTDWIGSIGKHAGILLDAPAEPLVLYAHLRKAFIVQDDTGQEFYLRFYDPRVLREFLPTCTCEELEEFFGPVRRWIVETASADGYVAFSRDEWGALGQQALGKLQLG